MVISRYEDSEVDDGEEDEEEGDEEAAANDDDEEEEEEEEEGMFPPFSRPATLAYARIAVTFALLSHHWVSLRALSPAVLSCPSHQ